MYLSFASMYIVLASDNPTRLQYLVLPEAYHLGDKLLVLLKR